MISRSEERADCEVTTEILAKSKRVGETGRWRQCPFIVVRVALIGIVIVQTFIVEPTEKEVMRDWSELHEEELYDLYYSPSMIRVYKSRRVK